MGCNPALHISTHKDVTYKLYSILKMKNVSDITVKNNFFKLFGIVFKNVKILRNE